MDRGLLRRAAGSVCAIGWLPPEYVGPDGNLLMAEGLGRHASGVKVNVCGTGFLVTPTLVCTAGHVVGGMRRRGISPAQIVAGFYHVEQEFSCIAFARFRGAMRFSVGGIGPDDSKPQADLAFMLMPEPATLPPPNTGWHPVGLEIADISTVDVQSEVIVIGYYMGQALVENPRMVSDRFGPLTLRGYISAISPYDYDVARGRPPLEYFIDVTAAGGLSGAPVIQPSTGAVLGMVRAGAEREVQLEGESRTFLVPANMALALPLTAQFVEKTIREIEAKSSGSAEAVA
jgi:hypothetical protein